MLLPEHVLLEGRVACGRMCVPRGGGLTAKAVGGHRGGGMQGRTWQLPSQVGQVCTKGPPAVTNLQAISHTHKQQHPFASRDSPLQHGHQISRALALGIDQVGAKQLAAGGMVLWQASLAQGLAQGSCTKQG